MKPDNKEQGLGSGCGYQHLWPQTKDTNVARHKCHLHNKGLAGICKNMSEHS